MYRELAWFYQHKMGQNLDDAHNYYKAAWAKEMTDLFGGTRPVFEELLNPQTDAARQRLKTLRQKYKLDAKLMKELDEQYGPLEWRLPEAHAIYWASMGLRESKEKDQKTLRRAIYQSMHIVVLRGKIAYVDANGRVITSPDLDKIARANATYEQMIQDDAELRESVQRAHRNFLKEVVYLLYMYNRLKEGEYWLKQVREKYTNAIPANLTLEEYALGRLKENLPTLSHDLTRAVLEGLITQHFFSVAIDEDDRAEGMDRMARQLWNFYDGQAAVRPDALKFPPLKQIKKTILDRLMNPDSGLMPEIRERLRKKLNLPEATPVSATNAPAGK